MIFSSRNSEVLVSSFLSNLKIESVGFPFLLDLPVLLGRFRKLLGSSLVSVLLA